MPVRRGPENGHDTAPQIDCELTHRQRFLRQKIGDAEERGKIFRGIHDRPQPQHRCMIAAAVRQIPGAADQRIDRPRAGPPVAPQNDAATFGFVAIFSAFDDRKKKRLADEVGPNWLDYISRRRQVVAQTLRHHLRVGRVFQCKRFHLLADQLCQRGGRAAVLQRHAGRQVFQQPAVVGEPVCPGVFFQPCRLDRRHRAREFHPVKRQRRRRAVAGGVNARHHQIERLVVDPAVGEPGIEPPVRPRWRWHLHGDGRIEQRRRQPHGLGEQRPAIGRHTQRGQRNQGATADEIGRAGAIGRFQPGQFRPPAAFRIGLAFQQQNTQPAAAPPVALRRQEGKPVFQHRERGGGVIDHDQRIPRQYPVHEVLCRVEAGQLGAGGEGGDPAGGFGCLAGLDRQAGFSGAGAAGDAQHRDVLR